jgi:hypothetical protein
MGAKRVVPDVGTGTLGEPVISLLRNLQQYCSIDADTEPKNRPLLQEHRRIIKLMRHSAKLAVQTEKPAALWKRGRHPLYTRQEALAQAIEGRFLCLRRAIECRTPYVFDDM